MGSNGVAEGELGGLAESHRVYNPREGSQPWLMDRRVLFVLSVLVGLWALHDPVASQARPWLEFPLPYAAETKVRCLQGAFGRYTHKTVAAWDLGAGAGTPILSVCPGRVIQVIDSRTASGSQSYNDSNRIIIDIGERRFASYLHLQTGSAKVRPGQRVELGTVLATEGNIGTIQPHLHFDICGPTNGSQFMLRWLTATGLKELVEGQEAVSNTRFSGTQSFRESTLAGSEFKAFGVTFQGGQRSYFWRAEEYQLISGESTGGVVNFYLWEDGLTSDFSASATPNDRGQFQLRFKIGSKLRGPRWLLITSATQSKKKPDPIPVMIQ